MALRSLLRRRLVLSAVLSAWTGMAAWAAHAPAFAHVVAVRLHASASVAQAVVTLGELADIEGADHALVLRLHNLSLGRIGADRMSVELRRDDIARWACMKGGVCGEQVAWDGARRIEVRAAPHVVGSDALVEVARRELERALARLDARLAIDASEAAHGVELPAGAAVFSARALPPGSVPTRHMVVWVDILVDGRFVRAEPVRFDVSARVPAWIARDDIPAGARVTATALAPGEVDLVVMSGATPRRRAAASDAPDEVLRARHDLHPGQALTTANSGPVPLVACGETALLRVHSSPIELESRVDVLQDGFLGQTVRVRARNAGNTLLARVAGQGLLEAQN
jgi:flagella basal body P-ring formation protein FlgA